jgi:hypothetical protein
VHIARIVIDRVLIITRQGKELGAVFSGAFSVFGLLDAVADVYNGVG